MAQRTGAKRFLVSMAKVAGPGVLPALATAAALTAAALMALVGCGGGTNDSSSATASVKQAPAAQGSESTTTSAQAKVPSSAEEEERNAAAKVRAAAGKGNKKSGKQGPTIATPRGEQEPEITPEQRANATAANIALSSTATGSGRSLPATYTCDGKNISPQLKWQGVPSGTAELALFAMNIKPVGEQIFFDWAVGGIDPSLSGIDAGGLPSGAVIGKNSFGKVGYSICPPQGEGETYMFVLYALPKSLDPKQGFDALALREEALKQSGNDGLMAASYTRH